MPMISFFAWFYLHDDLVEIEEFRLLAFERGQKPFHDDPPRQALVDRVLAPYVIRARSSVDRAMVLGLKDRGLLDDLSDEERERCFSFAQMLAFAGLAGRWFFGHGMGYNNRDKFTFIIQSFQGSSQGAAVTSRRRDGHGLHYLSDDTYTVPSPFHVSPGPEPRLPIDFLKALLLARDTDFWPALEEAVFWFNNANTDSDQVPEPSECVMLVSAFERLFDCRNGKEEDLAERFGTCFLPTTALPAIEPKRVPENLRKKSKSLAEAWIRDLFRLRGGLAHGRKEGGYKPTWTLREHLLLASYAFPLTVKLRLRVLNLYAWTDADDFDVAILDRLLDADLFSPRDRAAGDGWPWDEVREEHRTRFMVARAYHQVEREDRAAAEAGAGGDRPAPPASTPGQEIS